MGRLGASRDGFPFDGSHAHQPIIYAELASGYRSPDALDSDLDELELRVVETPKLALFRAGQAFLRYRRSKGPKDRVLADFLVGAHAATLGIPLVTRNARDYRTYFPEIELVAPP